MNVNRKAYKRLLHDRLFVYLGFAFIKTISATYRKIIVHPEIELDILKKGYVPISPICLDGTLYEDLHQEMGPGRYMKSVKRHAKDTKWVISLTVPVALLVSSNQGCSRSPSIRECLSFQPLYPQNGNGDSTAGIDLSSQNHFPVLS